MKCMLGPVAQRVSSHCHHDDCGPATLMASHALYDDVEMIVCVSDRGRSEPQSRSARGHGYFTV